MRNLVLLACGVLTACSLYENNPSPDAAPVPCYASPPSTPQERNPANGVCEPVGDPCGCTDPCGVCPPCAPGSNEPPVWPSCSGMCDALAETACLATAGCHAAYGETANQTPQFWGCWDIAPLSPTEGGGCSNLGDYACIVHDNCTSLYSYVLDNSQPEEEAFVSCNAKTTLPTCSTLTTAAACKARTDCEPIYVGSQCTCTPSGCTCQVETFDYCQAN